MPMTHEEFLLERDRLMKKEGDISEGEATAIMEHMLGGCTVCLAEEKGRARPPDLTEEMLIKFQERFFDVLFQMESPEET